MKAKEYLEKWMKDEYPHNKYVNALSFKWIIKFAEDYHKYKKII